MGPLDFEEDAWSILWLSLKKQSSGVAPAILKSTEFTEFLESAPPDSVNLMYRDRP